MAELDKYSGRFLAASNTEAFCSLDNKMDLLSGESYGELSIGLTSKAGLAATIFELDENKLEFLSRMIFLGKIDGGNEVLDRINEELVSRGLNPIRELDIAYKNFTSIFPQYRNSFSREELTEVFNMIMKKSETDSGKLIEVLVDLQRISKYMKTNYGWDASKIVSYEYDQLKQMKSNYDKYKSIELTGEAQSIINQINQIKYKVDDDCIVQVVDSMNAGSNTKESQIEVLNNFRYMPQKKTRGIN